jgi:hypothetical protein
MSTRTAADVRQFFARQAISALAGPMAQFRSRGCSDLPPGWVELRFPTREVAVHEAGHAVASLALGWFVQHLSIAPQAKVRSPGGQYSVAGFCSASTVQEQLACELPEELPLDHSVVAGAALLLTSPEPGVPCWKAVLKTVRLARRIAAQILEQNWDIVLLLASELERQKQMDSAAITSFLEKFRRPIKYVDQAQLAALSG